MRHFWRHFGRHFLAFRHFESISFLYRVFIIIRSSMVMNEGICTSRFTGLSLCKLVSWSHLPAQSPITWAVKRNHCKNCSVPGQIARHRLIVVSHVVTPQHLLLRRSVLWCHVVAPLLWRHPVLRCHVAVPYCGAHVVEASHVAEPCCGAM